MELLDKSYELRRDLWRASQELEKLMFKAYALVAETPDVEYKAENPLYQSPSVESSKAEWEWDNDETFKVNMNFLYRKIQALEAAAKQRENFEVGTAAYLEQIRLWHNEVEAATPPLPVSVATAENAYQGWLWQGDWHPWEWFSLEQLDKLASYGVEVARIKAAVRRQNATPPASSPSSHPTGTAPTTTPPSESYSGQPPSAPTESQEADGTPSALMGTRSALFRSQCDGIAQELYGWLNAEGITMKPFQFEPFSSFLKFRLELLTTSSSTAAGDPGPAGECQSCRALHHEAAQKQLFLEIVSENADIIANQRDAARAALTTLVEALGECEAVRMAAGHVYTNPTNPNYCRCHRRALPCPVAVAREKLDKGI